MNLIEIKNLTKKYEKKIIFENLNMSIPDKGVVILKGINGCGKSTLINIIAKITKYNDGIIKYNDPHFFKKSAFLLDTPIFLESLTYKDNMKLIGSLLKIRPNEINQTITYYQNLFNLPLTTLYGNFSLGMKKKAEIARTLINNPKYIFWDEPFNSLDRESVDLVLNELIDDQKLFFIITHELYLDHIANEILEF